MTAARVSGVMGVNGVMRVSRLFDDTLTPSNERTGRRTDEPQSHGGRLRTEQPQPQRQPGSRDTRARPVPGRIFGTPVAVSAFSVRGGRKPSPAPRGTTHDAPIPTVT